MEGWEGWTLHAQRTRSRRQPHALFPRAQKVDETTEARGCKLAYQWPICSKCQGNIVFSVDISSARRFFPSKFPFRSAKAISLGALVVCI